MHVGGLVHTNKQQVIFDLGIGIMWLIKFCRKMRKLLWKDFAICYVPYRRYVGLWCFKCRILRLAIFFCINYSSFTRVTVKELHSFHRFDFYMISLEMLKGSEKDSQKGKRKWRKTIKRSTSNFKYNHPWIIKSWPKYRSGNAFLV